MPIKDRRATKQPYREGVGREAFYGKRLDGGVTMEKILGLPEQDKRFPSGPGSPKKDYKAGCLGVKKNGDDCGAAPLKGRDLCWFHDRQLSEVDDSSGD